MSELIGVKVEGVKRLRTTMRKAGADMKDMSRLNRDAANTVLPLAKALAPVGDPKNGHIRNTIRVGATQKAGIIRAGNKRMPYGGVQHFGWPARGIQAKPWISIAAKQTEPVWVQGYFDGLTKVINKIEGA